MPRNKHWSNEIKNQYFGDISDYRKYGLLRQIGDIGISTVVCWMLTPNDPRSDGHRIQYLLNPEEWREYDPLLFDFLQDQVVIKQERKIDSVQEKGILAKHRFYSRVLPDDDDSRKKYFREFRRRSHDADLIFFDPDNGFEVKSVKPGGKKSSKYIYWAEIESFYNAGHSLLIYQHLPPKSREALALDIIQRIGAITGVHHVYLYHTQFVIFFLIPQAKHDAVFSRLNKRLTKAWGNQIRVEERNPT